MYRSFYQVRGRKRLSSINWYVDVLSSMIFEFRFFLLMPLSQKTAHPPAHPAFSGALFVSGGKRLREHERAKLKSPSELTRIQRRLWTVS